MAFGAVPLIMWSLPCKSIWRRLEPASQPPTLPRPATPYISQVTSQGAPVNWLLAGVYC